MLFNLFHKNTSADLLFHKNTSAIAEISLKGFDP